MLRLTAWLTAASNPLVSMGFADLSNLVRAIDRHEKIKSCITSSLKLSQTGDLKQRNRMQTLKACFTEINQR